VLTNPEPDMTLLTWLRSAGVGLTGTKLGCGEGGCGACTVMLSHWDREKKKIIHRSINSCLAPLCSVDGHAIVTIEGIGNVKKMHPIQSRISSYNGSQCGFCTPGIAMAVYAYLRAHPHATRAELEDAMDGNLCRCTGYRPILDAIKSFASDSEDCPKARELKPSQKVATGTNFKYVCPSTGKPCNCGKYFASEVELAENRSENSETTESINDPSEPIFPPSLKEWQPEPLKIVGKNSTWYRPVTLSQLLYLKKEYPHAKIIVGATELTIEMRTRQYPILISPVAVPELTKVEITKEFVTVGAAVTLTRLIEVLKDECARRPEYECWTFKAILEQLRWFGGHQIRNAACLGGNIYTASPISDINPILIASGATVTVASAGKEPRTIRVDNDFIIDYRKTCLTPEEVIISIQIPATRKNEFVQAYKQSRRRDDDIAIESAAYRTVFERDEKSGQWIVKEAVLSYGGMAKLTVRARGTEKFLVGKPWDESILNDVYKQLDIDLPLAPNAPGGMILYRKTLTTCFFFKYFLWVRNKLGFEIPASYANVLDPISRPLSSGIQIWENKIGMFPVGKPIPNINADKQITGEALYTDDIPNPPGGLYAAFVFSQKAYARIRRIDASDALTMPGVVAFISAKDIPGENNIGPVYHDEELFASEYVVCHGFPIGVIVANTYREAQNAARKVIVDYEELTPIITIEDAIAKKSFQGPVRRLNVGNVDEAFKTCDYVFEGETFVNGQEHFYLETQTSLCIPGETDEMLIWSSTQNPHETQMKVAETLGIPANRIVVKVKRMGGGFGGKETRSIFVAAACAVAAAKLRRPVRMSLDRDEDMMISGGRHPFLGKWKIGFNKDGKIIALDLHLYSNGGYSMDLSSGVMDRAMCHAENVYKIPNFRATGIICKTNIPTSTAFRGFGAPQAMLIAESWIDRIIHTLPHIPPHKIREINFLKEGDVTPYGQTLEYCHLDRVWRQLLEVSHYEERVAKVKQFNATSRWKKRGIACIPTKYGMSFLTARHLNQAGALVHVYLDGSVLVTHGGCEMGQGLHTKMIQIAAKALGIPVEKVFIAETSTDKVANSSPTAASVQSDLNGMAVLQACKEIMDRLAPLRRQMDPNTTWEQLIRKAYFDRIDLSAHGFYKTPNLWFDWETGTGRPFAYYNYGAACSEVEIDCLTGDMTVLRTDIVMDVGESLNPAIDIGQIEGAFIQGMGLFTLEEVVIFSDGRMFTKGPSTYKLPGFKDIPLQFNIHLLKDAPNPFCVHSSKGIGEPPLFLASSVFFAIKDAISYARNCSEDAGHKGWFPLSSPATCEKIRMSCKDDFTLQFDPMLLPY